MPPILSRIRAGLLPVSLLFLMGSVLPTAARGQAEIDDGPGTVGEPGVAAREANDPALDGINTQIREMIDRQKRLEQENAALRARLDAMVDSAGATATAEQQAARQQMIDAAIADALSRQTTFVDSVGFNPGGGGFYIKGEDYHFRLLGYVQAVGTVTDGSIDRGDSPGDFSVRRARIDFLADFYDGFQILVEFDGGPGTTPTAASDFALVEARLNWKVLDDALQLRFGKFTTPFSTENFRSSRSIDTIERYIALNSMFLLPALDVQYGVMMHGQVGPEMRLGYFVGIFNGNGRANDNFSDDNGEKEYQAKLSYKFSDELSAGVGFDYSREEQQTLPLADLAFNRYTSTTIDGARYGIEGDLFWQRGDWSFRAEGLAFRFNTPGDADEAELYGGFVQPAYFLSGTDQKGVQVLLRPEFAHLDADTASQGDTLYSLTLGLNWFINPNTRLQVNPAITYFDGGSTLQGFEGERVTALLLTELQFKF